MTGSPSANAEGRGGKLSPFCVPLLLPGEGTAMRGRLLRGLFA
jgi:hypothetical protein